MCYYRINSDNKARVGTKYLSALNIAEAARSNSFKSAKVCPNQCQVLVEAFHTVLDFLKELQKIPYINGLVWDEVLGVLYRGLKLLQSCKTENWIVRSLFCQESQEDFKDAYTELRACVELLSIRLFGVVSSEMDKSTVLEAYSTFLIAWQLSPANLLEDASRKDREHLVTKASAPEDTRSISKLWKNQSYNEECALQLLRKQLSTDLDIDPSAVSIDHEQIKFKSHISQGAYGTVYEAVWLKHIFAVKVFLPGDVSFANELEVLAHHKHPNIVSIVGHSYNRDKKQYSLVMEKMDMDLMTLIQKHPPLSLASSLSILSQVAKAMAWLHSKGVMHRDLKPQNVLVSFRSYEQLIVKVSDFGLARTNFVTSEDASASEKRGTKIFMAPEVWSSKHYSRKADVYSFGILCYQVLLGCVPFDGEHERVDFMDLVCAGLRPNLLHTSLSSELINLMESCWRQKPRERPSFLEVCERLRSFKGAFLAGSEYEVTCARLTRSQTTRPLALSDAPTS